MAHTFRQKSQLNAQTGNPVSHNHTPGARATVAILSIVVGGTGTRGGGAPTIDGTTALQVDTRRGGTGYSTSVEVWYVCKVFSGAQFSVSVPNSGGLTLHLEVVTADAGAGFVSELNNGNGNGSTTGNGFSVNVTAAAVGDFLYSRLGCGENAPASITETSGTPTKNVSYSNDHGAYSSFSHYANADNSGTETFTYVWSSDDGAAVSGAFRSATAPTVSIASVNMRNSNPGGNV